MSTANFRGFQALRQHPLIGGLRQRLEGGSEFSIGGVMGSAAPFILSLLLEDLDLPAVVVLQDEDDLNDVQNEFKTWTRERNLFPYPFVHAQVSNLEHAALMQQMKAVRAFIDKEAGRNIWLGTLAALDAPCFSLDFIDRPVLELEPGARLALDAFLQQLEAKGFHSEDKVDQRGDFAVRGGIIDIFPRFSQHPVRIELDGDEIETIREFSAVTQKSIRQLARFTLDEIDYGEVSMIKRAGSLLDYLPQGTTFFVQTPELIMRGHEGAGGRLAALLLDPDPAARRQAGMRVVPFAARIEDCAQHFDTILGEPLNMERGEAVDFLRSRCGRGEVFLVEDFGASLKLAEQGKLDLWTLEGALESNFQIPCLGMEAFHENNLIHMSELAEAGSQDSAIADFLELELGDHIVHESYGIGQFLGLVSLEKSGVTNDYMLLQFAGGSKVYVPVSQLNLVQKYIGRGEAAPELSKIGSKSWEMKKTRARKAIEKIVMELVHRQAFREKQNGFAFSADSKEQRAFERAFPYTETPCQTRASINIKREMENPRPMDHLLCGDVGFGKTEIAMRIAHKAVLDGKQVAVLAPTTILAEQHYTNFCERFREKAGLIGIASRFHGKKETDEMLRRVAAGQLMVIIGTHRLLSKDVEFRDLGLLILDEEQRFGVRQKEVLKQKFPHIDVLSLSATPIPRTLHMGMLGIRGISNLTIAPENRHPIRTYIREHDKGVIKHAIQRELDRGGQSYFLHNRIEDIHDIEAELRGLFPAARIGVGHGQMSEQELSAVMRAFYALEIDIFLSTSIIANGIDIPTANTMVINNAHLFGLSELHQIRGRIGRYTIQAYCYLLLPAGAVLAPASMRRLRAVEEHQELGAGFKLAMKDMEIRGVGNILGDDQHGQISDIGYDLYTQYLGQAIAEMKGLAPTAFVETDLAWSVGSTYFPKSFLPSHADRIDFYRRISFSRTSTALDAIHKELRDRFGIIPAPTLQLLRLFQCKVALRGLGVKSLRRRGQGEQAILEPLDWSDELKLAWVLRNQGELSFNGDEQIVIKVDKLWNRLTAEKVKQDPYQRYSYYNEDNRPDPLDVLELVVRFINDSKLKATAAMAPATT